MKKLLSLFKTDFNVTYGFSSLAYNFKNKKNRWQIIILTLALFSLIPTYIMLIKGLNSVYQIYRQINQESMFLLLGFLVSQFIVFFF